MLWEVTTISPGRENQGRQNKLKRRKSRKRDLGSYWTLNGRHSHYEGEHRGREQNRLRKRKARKNDLRCHALKGLDSDVRRVSIEGENISSGREHRERISGGKRERKQNGDTEATRRKK